MCWSQSIVVGGWPGEWSPVFVVVVVFVFNLHGIIFLYLFLALFSGFWLLSHVKFPGTLMDCSLRINTKIKRHDLLRSYQNHCGEAPPPSESVTLMFSLKLILKTCNIWHTIKSRSKALPLIGGNKKYISVIPPGFQLKYNHSHRKGRVWNCGSNT